MSSLTAFLLARIDEDEEMARAADSGRWLGQDKGITFEWDADDWHDEETQARLEADTRANQHHITRWAPGRVLAESAAKRRILARHSRTPAGHWSGRGNCEGCGFHGDVGLAVTDDTTYCPELIDLVQVYADDPAFDTLWALTPHVRE